MKNDFEQITEKLSTLKRTTKSGQDPAPPAQLDRYKIYGERNTGTNFLSQLTAANTCATEIIPIGNHFPSDLLKTRTIDSFKLPQTKCRKVINNWIKQRAIDTQRNQSYHQELGWKHACVQTESLRQSPIFNKTLLIMLIRNPWNFALSLHRKPYNIIPSPARGITFSEFIRMPVICNDRDRVDGDLILENPVQLWNKKVASYFKARTLSPPNTYICFYEKIILAPQDFIRDVTIILGQEMPASVEIPQNSSKDDLRTFQDFQDAVRRFNPLDKMSKEDHEHIANQAGIELLSSCGYNIAE